MVARDRRSLSITDQIAPGIADMGHHGAIVAQTAGYNRGGDSDPARTRRAPSFVYIVIRRLNEATEKGGMRLPSGGFRKISKQTFDRGTGSDFSQCLSADSV